MGKNLSTERISKSYQRLLQIDPDDNTTVLDGAGSNVPDLVFSSDVTIGGDLETYRLKVGDNVAGTLDGLAVDGMISASGNLYLENNRQVYWPKADGLTGKFGIRGLNGSFRIGDDTEVFMEVSKSMTTVTGDISASTDIYAGDTSANGVVITSPDGTKYRLKVANGGTLSTESV